MAGSCGIVTAGLTAFYTARLVLLTFHGTSRAPKHVQEHVHESPLVMLGPLVLLAVGALCSGFLLRNTFIGAGFSAFWGSSIDVPGTLMQSIDQIPAWAALAPLIRRDHRPRGRRHHVYPRARRCRRRSRSASGRFICSCSTNGILMSSTMRFSSARRLRLAKFAWRFGDEQVIDGVPTGLATLTSDASTQTVKLQTGSIALYAFVMLIGLLGFLSLFLWVR